MSKKNIKSIIFAGTIILVIVILFMNFTGGNIEKKIIGSWVELEEDGGTEDGMWTFDKNGNVTMSSGSVTISGTYSFNGNKEIVMNLNYLWVNVMIDADIKISGNRLIFTDIVSNLDELNGESIRLEKMK